MANNFSANLVISPKGSILAVDIIDPGSGYTNTPIVSLYNPGGYGYGAILLPIMKKNPEDILAFDIAGCGEPTKSYLPNFNSPNNKTVGLGGGGYAVTPSIPLSASLIPADPPEVVKGKSIDKFVVIDAGVGYLQKPNGATGGGGKKFSKPQDTIVFCGGYNVYPPCTNVRVKRGNSVYLPFGTTGQIFDNEGNLLQTIYGRGPTKPILVLKTGILATPCVKEEDIVNLPVQASIPPNTPGIIITPIGSVDENGNLITSESRTSNRFSVYLNARPTNNVTVTISTAFPTEGFLSTNTLTFTPSNWNLPQIITVTGVDDSFIDGDIYYTLTATADNSGGYSGESASISIVNKDNDSLFPTEPTITPPLPTIPPPTFQLLPSPLEPNIYNVALEIGDIFIENSGINYSPEDVITIEPSNGAVLEPEFDRLGRVSRVRIINPGIGFTEFPKIRIYSDTGYNANIIPIFNVIRITDEVIDRDIIPPGTPLVSVVDCVGIQPPKREFVRVSE